MLDRLCSIIISVYDDGTSTIFLKRVRAYRCLYVYGTG